MTSRIPDVLRIFRVLDLKIDGWNICPRWFLQVKPWPTFIPLTLEVTKKGHQQNCQGTRKSKTGALETKALPFFEGGIRYVSFRGGFCLHFFPLQKTSEREIRECAQQMIYDMTLPWKYVVAKTLKFTCLENIVYHFFRQLWLVLGVKLMEINSNMVSRWTVILEFPYHDRIPSVFQPENGRSQGPLRINPIYTVDAGYLLGISL